MLKRTEFEALIPCRGEDPRLDRTVLQPELGYGPLYDPEGPDHWIIECRMSEQCLGVDVQLYARIGQCLDDLGARLPADLNYAAFTLGEVFIAQGSLLRSRSTCRPVPALQTVGRSPRSPSRRSP